MANIIKKLIISSLFYLASLTLAGCSKSASHLGMEHQRKRRMNYDALTNSCKFVPQAARHAGTQEARKDFITESVTVFTTLGTLAGGTIGYVAGTITGGITGAATGAVLGVATGAPLGAATRKAALGDVAIGVETTTLTRVAISAITGVTMGTIAGGIGGAIGGVIAGGTI